MINFLNQRKRRRLTQKGFSRMEKVRHPGIRGKDLEGGGHRSLVTTLAVASIWLCACGIILYRPTYPSYDFVAGQKADRFIYSEIPFEYEDQAQTQNKRLQATSQVPPVYRTDKHLTQQSIRRLESIRQALNPTLAATGGDPALVLDEDLRNLVSNLPGNIATGFEYATAGDRKWKFLQALTAEATTKGIAGPQEVQSRFDDTALDGMIYVMDRFGRKTQTVGQALQTPTVAAKVIAHRFVQQFSENAAAQLAALEMILSAVLTPNLVYDAVATTKAKQTAADKVPPIRKVIPAGMPLLQRGEKVTDEDLFRLERHQEALGAHRTSYENLRDSFHFSAVCLILVVLGCYVLGHLHPQIGRSNSQIILLTTLVIAQLILARGIADLYYTNWNASFFLYATLPLAFGGMMLSQLMGLRVALLGGTFTSLIISLQNGESMQLLLIGVFSSSVGAILMRRARRRFHAFRAGLGAGAMAFLTSAIFILHASIPWDILQGLLPEIFAIALLNGVLTSVAASAVLPVFEYAFGITTDVSLLELGDLNHPLLKKLQMEAPGTYHHSLMVATLAEQAAEAIGANPLLARVCSYFHDIGKIRHPDYFSENIWGKDPHASLQPRMSSLVILNHVKEGIDLALKYKLKKPIREAIAQHHGTNLVYYFYHRALQQQDRNPTEAPRVGEHEYRYPGPLPVRKEIAILSLADSCEAAARSLEKSTPQKIAALVNEIVLKRIRDGQLDQADLTLSELTIVKETLAKSLGTMLHARVKYPDEKNPDETDLFQAAAKAQAEKPVDAAAGDSPGPAADSPAAGVAES